MHPPLLRPHPLCQNVVDELMACHENNPYMKFFGECNDAKAALDLCFKQEKEVKRKANAEKARAQRDEFEAKWAAERGGSSQRRTAE
jgi:COX assembly protein 2